MKNIIIIIALLVSVYTGYGQNSIQEQQQAENGQQLRQVVKANTADLSTIKLHSLQKKSTSPKTPASPVINSTARPAQLANQPGQVKQVNNQQRIDALNAYKAQVKARDEASKAQAVRPVVSTLPAKTTVKHPLLAAPTNTTPAQSVKPLNK